MTSSAPSLIFSLIVFIALIWLAFRVQQHWRSQHRAAEYNEAAMLSAETMPSFSLTLDETQNWETLAISLLQDQRELSAIELVQEHTKLDFEAAKIQLYKLEDALEV